MSDDQVLELTRQGNEQALEFLYRKYYRMMLRLVVKNSGSEEEAKDVFQDALIVFWEKAHQPGFVLTSRISTFLYSVCQNLWRKELDRKSRLVREPQTEMAADFDPDRKERAQIVNHCIAQLGDTCQKILMYYYFDRLTMTDIAQKLGLSNADTAKSKKYKCKQELDKLIKSQFKETDFLD